VACYPQIVWLLYGFERSGRNDGTAYCIALVCICLHRAQLRESSSLIPEWSLLVGYKHEPQKSGKNGIFAEQKITKRIGSIWSATILLLPIPHLLCLLLPIPLLRLSPVFTSAGFCVHSQAPHQHLKHCRSSVVEKKRSKARMAAVSYGVCFTIFAVMAAAGVDIFDVR
jgi:hypothetical protein